MKTLLGCVLSGCLAGSVSATLIPFDLSPPGTDDAIGLDPDNVVTLAVPSTGSGDEIGPGIVYNDVTKILTLSAGYGSSQGFTDLTGAATIYHIHGPAPVGTNAGVAFNLAGLHSSAGTAGGSFVGTWGPLTAAEETNLLSDLYYINVHTSLNPGGEIRGQLTVVPEPSSLLLLGLAGVLVCGFRRLGG